MAKIKFVKEPGSGKKICAMAGSVRAVWRQTQDAYDRANAMNPSQVYRSKGRNGGSYDVKLNNPNYGLIKDMPGGMPRGRVHTANFAAAIIEREQNILLKALH